MDKIRDIEKYISTVKENNDFFKRYYYHSLIDLNLIKLDYILRHGILSKNLIIQNDFPSLYTHSSYDFDSKNGDTFVSLAEYTDKCSFNPLFESFSLHTLTSLSLLVDNCVNISSEGERKTYFDDEIFCLNKVEKSQLKGIILPDNLSKLTINSVNCLPNDLSCFTKRYISNWIKCIEEYFGKPIPNIYIVQLEESLDQLWSIVDEYECPEKWIGAIIRTQREKYGKDLKDILANILQYFWDLKYGFENSKYLDIVMMLNEDNLPVYEIKEKCLKKIN